MRWWIVYFDDATALLGGVIVTADTEFDAYAYATANSLVPVGAVVSIATRTADDYPIADDATQDATQMMTNNANYLSPALYDSPALSPQYLFPFRQTSPTGQAGLATTAAPVLSHPALTISGKVIGRTAIDPGDDTSVLPVEDGFYAVTARGVSIAAAVPGALTWAEMTLTQNTVPIANARQATSGVGLSEFAATLTGTLWLQGTDNGGYDNIQIQGFAETDSGTWTFSCYNFEMQRIA